MATTKGARADVRIVRKTRARSAEDEHHLRLVIDTIPTMVWSVLPDGKVDFVNQRWLEYTGLSIEEAIADAMRIMHREDVPSVLKTWSIAMAAGEAHECEMRLRRADGEYRWFLVRTVPLRDPQGNIAKWYGTSTDIEDRKRAEQASRVAATELQALSRRLVELQESERKALAREMHDRLGDTLTALGINLAILKEAIRGAPARARLEDSATLVKFTAAVVANIVAELRPPMIDEHGLAVAIEWHAKQFAERGGIAVSVQSELGGRLPPEVEIALFRIAQEALNNVTKHARAEHVRITLQASASEVVMSIVDDGIGLPRSAQASGRRSPGLGLVTMRERAYAVGGVFGIEPLPDRAGTRLTVRIAR